MEVRKLRVREGLNPTAFTNTVVMISPDDFSFNAQTAASNAFQKNLALTQVEVAAEATKEFQGMVHVLKDEGINVLTLPSRTDVTTPDAVFPNNWFSTDELGNLVLYPMLAPNRRAERQSAQLQQVLSDAGFMITNVIDLTNYENQDMFLEGTGSMVFSNRHKVAFAMESQRTNEVVFRDFCSKAHYEPVFFHAVDKFTKPIYHTNVIMAIGDGFVVLCTESIADVREKSMVLDYISQMGLEYIDITMEQLYQFSGNILALKSQSGKGKIIMSKSANNGFTDSQRKRLGQYGDLVTVQIPTIETIGGGSARCMMAEIFMPRK